MLRSIVVNLWQNLGTGIPGNTIPFTGNVSSMSSLDQEVDEELTKVAIGEMTIEVVDPGDVIWAFVQSQLPLPEPWYASTSYGAEVQVTNGGNLYICLTAGISAGSGGPTGTGSTITDGTVVWSYVSAGAPAATGLLPPYLQLVVGGQVKFTGILDPSRIVRHLASDQHRIEFGAQDWSVQLANTYLGAPSANPWLPNYPYSLGMEVILNGIVWKCTTAGKSGTTGPILGTIMTATDGTVVWTYVPPGWTRPAPSMAISTYNGSTPTTYNYLIIQKPVVSGDTSLWLQSVNGIFPQDTLAVVYSQTGQSGSFTVLGTDPELLCVNVLEQVPVGLKIGDGVYFDDATNQELVMADAVQTLQAAAYPFAVDTSRFVKPTLPMPVFSWLPVVNITQSSWLPSTAYTKGTQVKNGNQNIYQCSTAGTSASSGGPSGTGTLPITDGTAQWLYLQPTITNMVAISDIEATLTQVRIISGFACAYHGSPELGWTPEVPVALPATQPQYADWTNQLTSPPSSLMPYTCRTGNPATGTPGDAPYAPLRNRCYHAYTWGTCVDNGPTSWYQGPGWNTAVPAWSASIPSTWYDPFTSVSAYFQANGMAPTQIFYDYLLMRKIVIVTTFPSGTPVQTITVYPWTGSAWGSGTVLAWPGGHIITSLSNFPTGPSGALLAVTTLETLELGVLGAGSLLGAMTLGNLTLARSVLVPNPYGACLVGSINYGQVLYSGGVLTCPSVVLAFYSGNGINGPVTGFWPQTFVARTATEAVVLGRLDTTASNGDVTTESYIYRLTLPPNTAAPPLSIISSEPVSAGAPVFAGAILDPTKPGRVLGHWGGQLWMFDYGVSLTIERFTPDGMTALDCIEAVAAQFGALAVPLPSGTMAVISRNNTETPTALTVSMVKTDQALCWPHFYSTVRCTTQDGKLDWDAPTAGGPVGGKILELKNHPMLWRVGQCGAMAESYAQWFCVVRPQEEQEWTYGDASTAPPWEALPPFARVTVNGTGPWRILNFSQDFVKGKGKPVLVED